MSTKGNVRILVGIRHILRHPLIILICDSDKDTKCPIYVIPASFSINLIYQALKRRLLLPILRM